MPAHPAAVVFLSVIAGTFLTAFVLVSWNFYRAEDARKEKASQKRADDDARDNAQRREKAERWERYRANISAVASAIQLNNVSAARRSLDDAPAEHRGWEWRHFDSQTDDARFVLRGLAGSVDVVALSPDGARVASLGAGDGTLRLWNTATGKEQRILRTERNGAMVWDMATGKELASLHNKDPHGVIFPMSTAGVVSRFRGGIGNASIRWLDIASGTEVMRCSHGVMVCVAVSRDGRKIASAGHDRTIRV